MISSTQVRELEAQHVLQTYKRQPIVLVRGDGRRLFDADGREYLDFLSGIGVVVLGHSDAGLAEVLADQAKTLIHTSNLFYHPLQGQLAAKLAALSGLQRAFFCNSGTEAVEACLKFARRYWYSQGATGRTRFVALDHGFSGRTMGALSVTVEPALSRAVRSAHPGRDVRRRRTTWPALEAAVTDQTAAIIAEPIQGEGGVRPLTPEFAAAVARVTQSTGTLLIADEIQCGLGRTGHAFPLPVVRLETRPGHGRQGDRFGRARSARRWSASTSPRRSSPGTTARPTEAICSPPGPLSTCSSS